MLILIILCSTHTTLLHFFTALQSELLLGTRYMHAYDDGPGVCSLKKLHIRHFHSSILAWSIYLMLSFICVMCQIQHLEKHLPVLAHIVGALG